MFSAHYRVACFIHLFSDELTDLLLQLENESFVP